QRPDAGRRQCGQDRDRMHVAFIKDAQHDVDGQQGRQDQPRLAVERRLERLRGPLKLPRIVAGTPSSARALSIATVAWPSDVPSGRLNEIVEATNCDWW